MISKVEEIRIPCECVGGSILEAIPNNIIATSSLILYVCLQRLPKWVMVIIMRCNKRHILL